jgi:diguanylate cyclase (GGDEF)-like protein
VGGSNNDPWVDERSIIKESPFNRAVTGVRKTQFGIKAMSATQSMPAMSSTQSRMPAMTPPGNPPPQNLPPQLANSEAGVQFFMQNAPANVPPPSVVSEEQLDQMAMYDAETRLFNFRFLLRNLQRELNRGIYYGRPLSIMVIDLKQLKKVEGQYGLLAYSHALTCVTQTLLEACGPIDLIGRYTPERFLMILPEKDLGGVQVIAEALCQSFRAMAIPFQHNIEIRAAIGYASFCQELADIESLLAMADLGADLVLHKGGDGCCFAPNELD